MKFLIRFLYFPVVTFLQILAYGVVCEFILYQITEYTHSKDMAIGFGQLILGAILLIPNIVAAFSRTAKAQWVTAIVSFCLFVLAAFVVGLHEYPDEFWAHVPTALIVIAAKLGVDLLFIRSMLKLDK